jgi:hypothetical protein
MREVHSERGVTKSKRAIDREDSGLSRRLASYAAAAGGAVALLGISDPADAKIVYTRVSVNLTAAESTEYVLRPDRIHPALTLSFKLCSSRCVHLQATGKNGGEIIGESANFPSLGYPATLLTAGQQIGKNGSFRDKATFAAENIVYYGESSYGNFFSVTNGYFGFEFSIDGQTHYGWGRMTTSSPDGPDSISAKLTGFAYETIPNRRILAGQEQGSYAEPGAEGDGPTAQAGRSALGAIALGAAGVPVWRREEDSVARMTGV